MLFTSLEFLLFFFPVTLGIYFFLPHRARNYWLLLASLFFYAWGEPTFVLAMMFSIVFNYFAALRIEELYAKRSAQKGFLALTVFINLGILFVFKYMNFVTKNMREIFPVVQDTIPQTSFVLPIGISFFTFQAMSYVIDVYRGTPAQKNLGYLGLYISLFPQLIAGPIVRYTTVMDQMERREITWDTFSGGMLRFLYGFNKKILLANILAEVADAAFRMEELSIAMAWLGAVCYALQIYFDFSGYSEMAIGMGRMFGFRFLENFNHPYMSKTMTDFWRRWHISLGSWFRDYLYFPLGGSRVKSKWRLVFNLAVVWLATGAWHGASWNFIFWGMLHGTVIVIEKLFSLPQRLQKKNGIAALYQVFTLLVVLLGWVFFRAEGFLTGVTYVKAMFGLGGNLLTDSTFRFYLREYGMILAAGILCSTSLLQWCRKKIPHQRAEALWDQGAEVIQLLLFLVGVSCLVMNAHNPFIYFNF